MCGEQSCLTPVRTAPQGSPPHVRGTAFFPFLFTKTPRITPACAGNSTEVGEPVHEILDHPRMCGEQLPVVSRKYSVVGSPPHVRGTDPRNAAQRYHPGITPACAGNSNLFTHADILSKGSPPHVRGTDEVVRFLHKRSGITPACAGNRYKRTEEGLTGEDHPRMCGEQFSLCVPFWFSGGSPPHVRGTGFRSEFFPFYKRITPACAGNRLLLIRLLAGAVDHPRMCGDQEALSEKKK